MKKKLCSATFLITRNEEDVEITVDGYVCYVVDTRYGADADGHRWVCKVFPEDVEGLEAYDSEGESVDLTSDERDMAIELLTNKLLEEGEF
jgi:hypothetical protein